MCNSISKYAQMQGVLLIQHIKDYVYLDTLFNCLDGYA